MRRKISASVVGGPSEQKDYDSNQQQQIGDRPTPLTKENEAGKIKEAGPTEGKGGVQVILVTVPIS